MSILDGLDGEQEPSRLAMSFLIHQQTLAESGQILELSQSVSPQNSTKYECYWSFNLDTQKWSERVFVIAFIDLI